MFFSENCKINVGGNESVVGKYEMVELTSETATVQNDSINNCKVIMLYK